MNTQQEDRKLFSLELFPPKTEQGMEKLQEHVKRLARIDPLYISVTFGAGGSTQQRTFQCVEWLVSEGIEAAPHISCISSTSEEIIGMLQRYREQGIKRLVALRGDAPSGAGPVGRGELNYANELVALIRREFGQQFHVEVAAYPEVHPQAANARVDLQNFKRKVEAGADAAITQYFYNPDAYFHFVDSCLDQGIEIPIVPGIMPITNYSNLSRFSDTCGAEIPRWIRKRLESYADDVESIRAFGVEVVSKLCQRLLDGGAPGLHFYTMNQSAPVLKIWDNLGLDG